MNDSKLRVWRYNWENRRRVVLLLVLAHILCFSAIPIFIYFAAHGVDNPNIYTALVLIVLVPFFLDVALAIATWPQLSGEILKQFAAAHSFKPEQHPKFENEPAVLFRVGSQSWDLLLSRRLTNVFIGTYQGMRMKLFQCQLAFGHVSYLYTTIEMDSRKLLPRMLLTKKAAQIELLPVIRVYDIKSAIHVSKTLNKYFDVRAMSEDEKAVKQVFDESLVEQLINTPAYFALEFINNRIYIYVSGTLKSEAQLKEVLNLLKKVMENLDSPGVRAFKRYKLEPATSPAPR